MSASRTVRDASAHGHAVPERRAAHRFDVFENVAFPLREHTDLPERLIRQLVLTKLQAVGLRGAAELMPAELSGGMARRVALARAIVMDPEMLIYDEPFVGLDPISLGRDLAADPPAERRARASPASWCRTMCRRSPRWPTRCSCCRAARWWRSGTAQQMQANQTDIVRQFIGGLADGPVPFHYPAARLFRRADVARRGACEPR